MIHAALSPQLGDRPGHIKISRKQLPELGTQYPDNGVWLAIHIKGSSDNTRVRSEPAFPKPVGENRDRIPCLPFALLRRERASQNGSRAEHRKEICSHAQADDLLGLTLTSQSSGTDFEQRHFLEGSTLLLPIEEIWPGWAFALDPVLQIRLPDQREAIRIGI